MCTANNHLDHFFTRIVTLPETNIAPENGWLEYDRFLLGPGLFSGAKMLVSGIVTFLGNRESQYINRDLPRFHPGSDGEIQVITLSTSPTIIQKYVYIVFE